ncbi:MAG: NAD(P)-dependent oxidoreductase [Desulfobacterales bacterium]|jgi:nucleoside-diphosphate-sugar epimerase|nr:NAD(P)-dependent oxidoreductase [Desulfobacterales bacterium]MDP6808176.1 NAD(P)-dependent oxidoreductase [Desulfobacterales bacterium]|tara:strand:+ start:290 stop:1219 length:930 start_codon:yes stop_codon:yes gene_type:complete
MNVMVTGANGFLGSHIIEELTTQTGINVYGTYRHNSERLTQDKRGNLTYFHCDLSNRDAVFHIFKKYHIDVIIHTAASISNRCDSAYLCEAIKDNIASQANLVSEGLNHECKLYIYCSSIDVYGDFNLYKDKDGISEDILPRPMNIYGWSKYTAEESLRIMTQSKKKMKSASLRFSGIHGQGRTTGVVYKMIKSALSGEPIKVTEPRSRFKLLFVDDAIQTICLTLIKKHQLLYTCYNVAGKDILSLTELVEKIKTATDSTSKIHLLENSKARNKVLNTKKIEKELKYKPDNTDNNLQKFINHIKNSNC